MARNRNRRRSRSSRSMSPDLWQDDDLEAQKSTAHSSNTESKQKAPSVASTRSSAHRTPDAVSPTTSFHDAQSSGIRLSGDLETQSGTRPVPAAIGEALLQATEPLRIPLRPSVENLLQRGGHDSESASSGSAASIAAEDKRNSAQETSEPWTRCAESVWAYDTNKVDKWGKEISEKLVLFVSPLHLPSHVPWLFGSNRHVEVTGPECRSPLYSIGWPLFDSYHRLPSPILCFASTRHFHTRTRDHLVAIGCYIRPTARVGEWFSSSRCNAAEYSLRGYFISCSANIPYNNRFHLHTVVHGARLQSWSRIYRNGG